MLFDSAVSFRRKEDPPGNYYQDNETATATSSPSQTMTNCITTMQNQIKQTTMEGCPDITSKLEPTKSQLTSAFCLRPPNPFVMDDDDDDEDIFSFDSNESGSNGPSVSGGFGAADMSRFNKPSPPGVGPWTAAARREQLAMALSHCTQDAPKSTQSQIKQDTKQTPQSNLEGNVECKNSSLVLSNQQIRLNNDLPVEEQKISNGVNDENLEANQTVSAKGTEKVIPLNHLQEQGRSSASSIWRAHQGKKKGESRFKFPLAKDLEPLPVLIEEESRDEAMERTFSESTLSEESADKGPGVPSPSWRKRLLGRNFRETGTPSTPMHSTLSSFRVKSLFSRKKRESVQKTHLPKPDVVEVVHNLPAQQSSTGPDRAHSEEEVIFRRRQKDGSSRKPKHITRIVVSHIPSEDDTMGPHPVEHTVPPPPPIENKTETVRNISRSEDEDVLNNASSSSQSTYPVLLSQWMNQNHTSSENLIGLSHITHCFVPPYAATLLDEN